jgi:hypothetical protein
MGTWKSWANNAVQHGITNLNTLRSKTAPPLTFDTLRQALAGDLPAGKVGYSGHAVFVDYPPGTPYVLWLVGGLYQATSSPPFIDRPALNIAIKTPLLVADLLTAALIAGAARRRAGDRGGLIAFAALWLNPALILAGSWLAYLDILYAVPLVLGCLALLRGQTAGLWAGWAGALCFKLQPLLLAPAVLAVSARRGVGRLVGYGALAGGLLLAVALPYLATGHTLALISGVMGNANEEFISAYQFNAWWLWSYLYQARQSGWGVTPDILWRTDLAKHGISGLNSWALGAFVLFTVFANGVWLWRHLRGRRPALTEPALAAVQPPRGGIGVDAVLLIAFQLYGATMLLLSIHENHLLGALPLLGLAAAWTASAPSGEGAGVRPPGRLWGLYAALSAIVGLNLLLFYGLGEGLPNPLPRALLGLDLSVPLTLANIAVFLACCVAWARGGGRTPRPAA